MSSIKEEKGSRQSLAVAPNAPSLVFLHGKNWREQTFCTLFDGYCRRGSITDMSNCTCLGSYFGWLIMRRSFNHKYSPMDNCYLLDPVSLRKIALPTLTDKTFDVAILTCPPSDSDCFVLLISRGERSYLHCRLGDKRWSLRKFRIQKDISGLDVCNIIPISCNGKVYLLFYAGMYIVDARENFSLELTAIKGRDISLSGATWVNDYFFESCGEIFHVAGIHLGETQILQTCEVFRLDFLTSTWTKVHTIGERIFLWLGPTSFTSLSSKQLGVKGNCVYFSTSGTTILNKFDMEDESITPTLPCSRKFSHWDGPFLIIPNTNQHVIGPLSICRVKKVAQKVEVDLPEENINWKDGLQPELWDSIFCRLFLGDYARFRLVCKDFMTFRQPVREFNHHINSGSQHLPWFMSFKMNNRGLCNIFHPIYSDAYEMNFPELAGATVRCVKLGWLLMSKGNDVIFFFNPITRKTISLPDPEIGVSYCFVNISFSCPPDSSNCVVFGHLHSYDCILVFVYHIGQTEWWPYLIPSPYTFLPSNCSPVFYDGAFYSLGKDGKLGVFDPYGENQQDEWKLLQNVLVQEASSSTMHLLNTAAIRSFIMEHEGEILSVFIMGFWGKPIYVFKLEQSAGVSKWVKLQSLGNKVIFLSHTSSILMPAGLKGTENRIYLPRFQRVKDEALDSSSQHKDSVFYSLSTKEYHCFGAKDSSTDWINTSECWNCNLFQWPTDQAVRGCAQDGAIASCPNLEEKV